MKVLAKNRVPCVKDSWMFGYLLRRLGFINPRCNLLQGLVYVYGASIGVAGVLMGVVFQTNSALISFDSSTHWGCILCIRVLFFLLTPFLAVVAIMKVISLKQKKEELETEYKKIPENATATWKKIWELEKEEEDVVEAFSDLKMVEASTEGIVQMILLAIFTFASVLLPTTSGLGLLSQNTSYEWTFLAFSFFTTIFNANRSILGAMDIRKKEQLDLKQKIILGISFTFQLFTHVFLFVSIALLALPLKDLPANDSEYASLKVIHAVILLALPIVLRWISFLVLHYCLSENETRFWDLPKRKQFLHVLANTWVTTPVRSTKMNDQVHRSTEIRWSMVLAGVNIFATWAMTSTLMKDRNPRFLSELDFKSNTEFRLIGVFPALLCHLAGCAFLHLYYRSCI